MLKLYYFGCKVTAVYHFGSQFYSFFKQEIVPSLKALLQNETKKSKIQVLFMPCIHENVSGPRW